MGLNNEGGLPRARLRRKYKWATKSWFNPDGCLGAVSSAWRRPAGHFFRALVWEIPQKLCFIPFGTNSLEVQRGLRLAREIIPKQLEGQRAIWNTSMGASQRPRTGGRGRGHRGRDERSLPGGRFRLAGGAFGQKGNKGPLFAAEIFLGFLPAGLWAEASNPAFPRQLPANN